MQNKSLQGGSIVRLFHRELECYLVAEGSFANDDKAVIEKGIHNQKAMQQVYLLM